jgi:hypothetical protein
LERFIDVKGEEFKMYALRRLEELCADEQMWRYKWCVGGVVCRVSCVVCRVILCRVVCRVILCRVVCRVSCVVCRVSCVVCRVSCVVCRASCVVRSPAVQAVSRRDTGPSRRRYHAC